MNNYCKQGNCECKFMEDTRRYAIDVPELYKRINTATNQYNAVVAQNKSLQGELNVYKIMTKNLIMLKAGEYSKYHQTFTKFKIQALEELEAEND